MGNPIENALFSWINGGGSPGSESTSPGKSASPGSGSGSPGQLGVGVITSASVHIERYP